MRPEVRPYGNLWIGAAREIRGTLTGKDLSFDSLYNSMSTAGSSRAIGNPGEASLRARCSRRGRLPLFRGYTQGDIFLVRPW